MTDLTCNPAATDAATPTATPLATPATPAAFAALGLDQPLLKAVADLGFTQPTLVQQAVIPKAMQAEGSARPGGHAFTDLMVSSQTGSGKTAAFLLPVLHTLLREGELEAVSSRPESPPWRAAPVLVPRNGTRVRFRAGASRATV